jgi:hypothetical protein
MGMGGINHKTIDLSAYLLAMEITSFSPPHLDSVSLLLIAFFSILLNFTRPLRNYHEEE